MVTVILIGHGIIGYSMKESMEMIYGKTSNVIPISFLMEDGLDTVINNIEKAAENMDEILIISDLFAGTPFNASCAYAMRHREKKIEVLSGMSVPLVLEAVSMTHTHTISEIADHILQMTDQIIRRFDRNSIYEEEDF